MVASTPGEGAKIAFLALTRLIIGADPAVDGDLPQLTPPPRRSASGRFGKSGVFCALQVCSTNLSLTSTALAKESPGLRHPGLAGIQHPPRARPRNRKNGRTRLVGSTQRSKSGSGRATATQRLPGSTGLGPAY